MCDRTVQPTQSRGPQARAEVHRQLFASILVVGRYQILTRALGSRYSRWPGRTSKASYHASRLRTVEKRYMFGSVIIGELCAHGGIAHLRAPGLSERDEKLPVLLPDIAPVSRSLAEREAIRVERRSEAGKIGDVLLSVSLPSTAASGKGR